MLTGEFVGRSSETQREMRKQWNLSDAANGPTQTRNHPQNEKTDQKTGRRRILKMVEVRAVFGHSDCASQFHVFKHSTLKFGTL